jgi:hypothetical protein
MCGLSRARCRLCSGIWCGAMLAGSGEPLPEPEVRAMLLLRANVLAKGFSGVRPELLEMLLALLNRGIHPVIPSRGSVGASGDLAPLAHLALAHDGRRPGADGRPADSGSDGDAEDGTQLRWCSKRRKAWRC